MFVEGMFVGKTCLLPCDVPRIPSRSSELGPRVCDLPATSAGPRRYESNSYALHLEERVKNGQVRTMLLTIPSIAEMLGGVDWLPAVYS